MIPWNLKTPSHPICGLLNLSSCGSYFSSTSPRASPSSAFSRNSCKKFGDLRDPSLEPITLAEYGATLIAVSSLCNGVGRLFWGLLSDRIGRVGVFRILLASQMIVFGILMTERNPWIFSALVCYVLLCFGGGFATMPSFVLGRLWQQKNVHHLRGNPNRLGRSGNLWPALRGLSERPIPRPRSHLLLFDRHFYARPRLHLLLFAKRRPHSSE